MKYDKLQIINLPKIIDERGNLSFIEEETHLPFKIKRVYWIYDVPGGEVRGSHSFKETDELIIALSGSFEVILHDGTKEIRHFLNRSYYGLFIPRGLWRKLENFSTNSLCLILSSNDFIESDYIRDFDEFLKITTIGKEQNI